jgi:uncharacterized membrane protein
MSHVDQEDCRKLHAEVTQMVSQRFQLTTAAIVAFSAISGWLTSAVEINDRDTFLFVESVSLLLMAILGMLFYYFHSLLGPMRIFTTYLAVKHGSEWERDWKDYRTDPVTKVYTGYSAAGKALFLILGLLSLVYPQVVLWIRPRELATNTG